MSSKELVTVSQYLSKNEVLVKQQIQNALPKHMDAAKMYRVLLTELTRIPDLNKCTVKSVLSGLIQSSTLGLEPGGVLGHSYLIPYRNNKNGTYECQFILGYRGMIDLARRSGQLVSIQAHAVYEKDTFEFEYGLNEKLRHLPSLKDRGTFVCAYALAALSGTVTVGGQQAYQFEVMTKEDVDKIRGRSQSSGSQYSPWKTDYEEMAKKTVIRRLFKYLPISTELRDVIAAEEEFERDSDAGQKYSAELIEDGVIIMPETPTKADAIADKLGDTTKDFIKDMGEVAA